MNKRWFITHLLPLLLAVLLVGGGVVYAVPSFREKAAEIVKKGIGIFADIEQVDQGNQKESLSACFAKPADYNGGDIAAEGKTIGNIVATPTFVTLDNLEDTIIHTQLTNSLENTWIKRADYSNNEQTDAQGTASAGIAAWSEAVVVNTSGPGNVDANSKTYWSVPLKTPTKPYQSSYGPYWRSPILWEDYQAAVAGGGGAPAYFESGNSWTADLKLNIGPTTDRYYTLTGDLWGSDFPILKWYLVSGELGATVLQQNQRQMVSDGWRGKEYVGLYLGLQDLQITPEKETIFINSEGKASTKVTFNTQTKEKHKPTMVNTIVTISGGELGSNAQLLNTNEEQGSKTYKVVSSRPYDFQADESGKYEIKARVEDECGAQEEKIITIKVLGISLNYGIERTVIKPIDLDVETSGENNVEEIQANIQDGELKEPINLYFGDKLKFHAVLKNGSGDELNTGNEPLKMTVPDFYRVESISDSGQIEESVLDNLTSKMSDQKITWKNITVPAANAGKPGEKRLEVILVPKLEKGNAKEVLDSYQKDNGKIDQEIKERSDSEMQEFDKYINDLTQGWISFAEKQNFTSPENKLQVVEQLKGDQTEFLKKLREEYTAINKDEAEGYDKTQKIITNFNKSIDREDWVSEEDIRNNFNNLRIEDSKRRQNLQNHTKNIENDWFYYLNWLSDQLEKIKNAKAESGKDITAYSDLLSEINVLKGKSFNLQSSISSLGIQEGFDFSNIYRDKTGQGYLKVDFSNYNAEVKINISSTVTPKLELRSFTHDGKTKINPQPSDKFLPGDILEFSVDLNNNLLADKNIFKDFYLKLKLSDGLEIIDGPEDLTWHYATLGLNKESSKIFKVKINENVSLDIKEIKVQAYTEFDSGTKLQTVANQLYDLYGTIEGKISGPYDRELAFVSVALKNENNNIISGIDVHDPNLFDYANIITSNEKGEFKFIYNRKDLQDSKKVKYEVYYKNVLWNQPQLSYLDQNDNLLYFRTQSFEIIGSKDEENNILINRCSSSPVWDYPSVDNNIYLQTYNVSKSYYYLASAWNLFQNKYPTTDPKSIDFQRNLLDDGLKVRYEPLGEETTDFFDYKDKVIHVNEDYNSEWLNYKPHSELHEFGHYLDWIINDYKLRYVKLKNTDSLDLNVVKKLGGFINEYSDDSFVEGLADWLAVYAYNEIEKNDLRNWDYGIYHNDGVAEYALNSLNSAMVGLYKGHTDLLRDSEIKAAATLFNALTVGYKSDFEISNSDYDLTPWINPDSFSQKATLKISRTNPADAVNNFMNILKQDKPYTIKDLFDSYARRGIYQDGANQIGLNRIQQLYLLYGFFVDSTGLDATPDWRYEQGEEIGRAANSAAFGSEVRYFEWMDSSWIGKIFKGLTESRLDRHNKAVFPGSYIFVSSTDKDTATSIYHTEIKFSNPFFNYSYDTLNEANQYEYIAPPPSGSEVNITNEQDTDIINIDSTNYIEALDSGLFEYMTAPDVQESQSGQNITKQNNTGSQEININDLVPNISSCVKASLQYPAEIVTSPQSQNNKGFIEQAKDFITNIFNPGNNNNQNDNKSGDSACRANLSQAYQGDKVKVTVSLKNTTSQILNDFTLSARLDLKDGNFNIDPGLGTRKDNIISWPVNNVSPNMTFTRDFTIEAKDNVASELKITSQLAKADLTKLGQEQTIHFGETNFAKLELLSFKRDGTTTSVQDLADFQAKPGDSLQFKAVLDNPDATSNLGANIMVVLPENFQFTSSETYQDLTKNVGSEDLFGWNLPRQTYIYSMKIEQVLDENGNKLDKIAKNFSVLVPEESQDDLSQDMQMANQQLNNQTESQNDNQNNTFPVALLAQFNGHFLKGDQQFISMDMGEENFLEYNEQDLNQPQGQSNQSSLLQNIGTFFNQTIPQTFQNVVNTTSQFINNTIDNVIQFLNGNNQQSYNNFQFSIFNFQISPVLAAETKVIVGPTISISSTTPSPIKAPISLVVDCRGFDQSKQITIYLDNKEYGQTPIISKNFGIKIDVPKNSMIGTHTIKVTGDNNQEAIVKFKVNQNSWWNKLTLGIGLVSIIILITLIVLIILIKKRRKIVQTQVI